MLEAERLCGKASNLLTKNKDSLTYEKRKEVGSNLDLGGVGQSYPSHNTEEEKISEWYWEIPEKINGSYI